MAKKNTATVKVDKVQVRKLNLTSTIGEWKSTPDLKHTQELMNAVRAYRRQLRKKNRKAKKSSRKAA